MGQSWGKHSSSWAEHRALIKKRAICLKILYWACSTLPPEYAKRCHRWQALTFPIRSADTRQFSTRSVTFCLIRTTLIITASFRGNHVLQWSIWRSLCINKLVIRIRHLIIWQHAAYDLIYGIRGTEAAEEAGSLWNSVFKPNSWSILVEKGIVKKKKKCTKATGVVESSNQRRIDSLFTYTRSRLRQKKDNFINLAIVWQHHKRMELVFFTRYFISYRRAVFLLISKTYTFVFIGVVQDIVVFCQQNGTGKSNYTSKNESSQRLLFKRLKVFSQSRKKKIYLRFVLATELLPSFS